MKDFKSKFDLEEKESYYLGWCDITQDLETGKIQIDPSKYIREMISKYDVTTDDRINHVFRYYVSQLSKFMSRPTTMT